MREFRRAVANPLANGHLERAQSLYGRLLNPFEAALEGKALTIVPHGALHYLPFAALHDGSIVMYPVNGLGSPGFFSALFGGSAIQEYPVMSGEIDWVGLKTTYFLGAAFPDSPTQARARFVVLETNRLGAAQLFFDPVEVPPGQRVSREFRGYLGPKDSERPTAFGAGAEASIDLGWRWVVPLARLFSWLLHALYSLIPNYGIGSPS